jgi:hypothetical protein
MELQQKTAEAERVAEERAKVLDVLSDDRGDQIKKLKSDLRVRLPAPHHELHRPVPHGAEPRARTSMHTRIKVHARTHKLACTHKHASMHIREFSCTHKITSRIFVTEPIPSPAQCMRAPAV